MSLSDGELAAVLANGAGAILIAARDSGRFEGAALGSAGDRAANHYLVEAIREQRPGDALLSEEMECDGSRLVADRVWIIDPLDGTREYGERRSDWAVHVALAVGGRAEVGAVALPGLGLVLRSDQPPVVPPPGPVLKMLVSRSRVPREAAAIAARLGAELVAMGSAGAKAMAVVRGEGDIYYHSGGQNEWDSAAPVAVAMAAGLHCSRIDGSPLVYNRENTSLPDLLICRPELAEQVIALTAELKPPLPSGRG